MQPEYSKSTGRLCADIATCAALALTIYHERMSLPAAFRVRTSAAPAGAWASPEADQDSGLSFGESFASYDQRMCLWRTSQHSFIEELTRYSATWPRSGLTRNGTAYRLPPLVRRISGIGSTSWPTPNATDGSKAPRFFGRGNPSLPHAAKMSPTPRAHETGDWQRDNKGRKLKRLTLTGAAKLWPTPMAVDAVGGSTNKSLSPNAAVRPTLARAVRMAPTPTVSDATGGPAYSRPPSRQGSPTLKESTPGQLNPMWVEWLMGFPLGWTDLEDSATPSYRNVPSALVEPL